MSEFDQQVAAAIRVALAPHIAFSADETGVVWISAPEVVIGTLVPRVAAAIEAAMQAAGKQEGDGTTQAIATLRGER